MPKSKHTHTRKYAHLYSAISSFLSPMAMHPGSNSHLFIQHSPSSIPPEFISEYLLYLLPLLLSRSGGIVAFVRSLRRTRNGSSNRPSVSSSHSPRGLALQQGAVRVKRVKMDKQRVLSCRCVAALLAHVQLVASLLVGVLQGDAVDLLHVRLQRAALGEGLVAEVALVWTDACVENERNIIRYLCVYGGLNMPKFNILYVWIYFKTIHLLSCFEKFNGVHFVHLFYGLNTQSEQLPVCVRTCLLRSKVSLKPLPQKLHRCLFVSLWHLTCLFNIRWYWKVFWQTCKWSKMMIRALPCFADLQPPFVFLVYQH